MEKRIVELTDSAKEYLAKVGAPNVSLTVKGGGCSGFQYEWGTTDKEPTVENLWLDPMAEMFVFGCTIDYVSELGGSYLKVVNPNATASCGCGESFAVQSFPIGVSLLAFIFQTFLRSTPFFCAKRFESQFSHT